MVRSQNFCHKNLPVITLHFCTPCRISYWSTSIFTQCLYSPFIMLFTRCCPDYTITMVWPTNHSAHVLLQTLRILRLTRLFPHTFQAITRREMLAAPSSVSRARQHSLRPHRRSVHGPASDDRQQLLHPLHCRGHAALHPHALRATVGRGEKMTSSPCHEFNAPPPAFFPQQPPRSTPTLNPGHRLC